MKDASTDAADERECLNAMVPASESSTVIQKDEVESSSTPDPGAASTSSSDPASTSSIVEDTAGNEDKADTSDSLSVQTANAATHIYGQSRITQFLGITLATMLLLSMHCDQ
jgi:hypothetical protein